MFVPLGILAMPLFLMSLCSFVLDVGRYKHAKFVRLL